jgi:uroporphyrinogen decarboxylase
MLTHRDRVHLALQHRTTDRIPMAMVCSGINRPAYEALQTYLRRERSLSVEQYLHPLIDILSVEPRYVGPPLAEGHDIWGVARRSVSYGSGSYDEIEHYPLAEVQHVATMDRYPWPTTAWFDYEALRRRIERAQAAEPYCLMVRGANIFETAWYMRGFERALMDLAEGAEVIDAIMERVTDFYLEHIACMLQAAEGQVDLVFTADDIGGQSGLLMSLDTWREHIYPHHRRQNDLIHRYDARVIYHTDGAVTRAVDGLIDMGIDILQALQFSARGMDPVELKRGWGDKLCFEGGVSVQTTLPFGTVEDVRGEVEQLIRVLGKDGGYILGPSHAIQAGTPPENIVALFDTAAGFHPF